MIETRRNAAVATAERLAKASSGNKGSRGFSPYMELEHAPYERTFMDYKIAAPSLTRFENRFYISAPTCLKRRKKEGGGGGKEERRKETRRDERKGGRKREKGEEKRKRKGEARIRQAAGRAARRLPASGASARAPGIQKCNDTSNWALETESSSTVFAVDAALLLTINGHSIRSARWIREKFTVIFLLERAPARKPRGKNFVPAKPRRRRINLDRPFLFTTRKKGGGGREGFVKCVKRHRSLFARRRVFVPSTNGRVAVTVVFETDL